MTKLMQIKTIKRLTEPNNRHIQVIFRILYHKLKILYIYYLKNYTLKVLKTIHFEKKYPSFKKCPKIFLFEIIT